MTKMLIFFFLISRWQNKKRLGECDRFDVYGTSMEARLFRQDRCSTRIPDILLSRRFH